MHHLDQPYTIDQKLQVMKPYINLALFNRSSDYRRQVLSCFEQHSLALKQLTETYSKQTCHEDYDCILGYN